MINTLYLLEKVIIEGYLNSKDSGEYLMDVAEYYKEDENGLGHLKYFQIKYITVHKNDTFTLREQKKAISRFDKKI